MFYCFNFNSFKNYIYIIGYFLFFLSIFIFILYMDDKTTKGITITGQHNKYGIKRAQREKQKDTKQIIYDEKILSYKEQINCINKIYLNNDFEEKKIYENEIKKKITSYKSQDVKKKRYDEDKIIDFDNVIEKLVTSKLKCKYCNKKILILTNKFRDNDQWTLERIDNNIGHNTDNVIISCLDCNLKRRNSNMDNFEYTKKLKINKCL